MGSKLIGQIERGDQSDRPHIVSRISHIHPSGPCVPPERNGESKGIEGQAVLAAPVGLGRGWWGQRLTIWWRQLSLPLFVVRGIEGRDTSAFSLSFLGAICELCSQTISIMCLAAPMWTLSISEMLNKLRRPSIIFITLRPQPGGSGGGPVRVFFTLWYFPEIRGTEPVH